MSTRISITELEQAINFWRARRPSQGEERRLCPEVAALAGPYAAMIFAGHRSIEAQALDEAAHAAWTAWQAQRQPGA